MQLRVAVGPDLACGVRFSRRLLLTAFVALHQNPPAQGFDLAAGQHAYARAGMLALDMVADVTFHGLPAPARVQHREAVAWSQVILGAHGSFLKTSTAWSRTVTFGHT